MTANVIPENLIHASLAERVEWLIEDAKSDDLMGGHPRYEPRYTERESQIIHLLRTVWRDDNGRET